MNSLKYFENRVCTIITLPINRNFREEAEAIGNKTLYPQNLLDHFMGRVVATEANAIVLQHPAIGTRSYFRLENIVGIIEEQELDPENPEHAKIIDQYKEKKGLPKSRGKVSCPKGHNLNIPEDIPDGSEVVCPVCNVDFVLGGKKAPPPKELPESKSEFIDIDMLSKMAKKP